MSEPMRVIAKNTLPEWNITAGRTYEVIKQIESTEIGTLFQLTADDGKVKNLKAVHFRGENDGVLGPTYSSEIIDMHRRQYNHNRECFERDCKKMIELMHPSISQEACNIQDVKEFIDQAEEYLLAMMFHINSLHVVGLRLGD